MYRRPLIDRIWQLSIGDPGNRLNQLQCGTFFPGEVVGFTPCGKNGDPITGLPAGESIPRMQPDAESTLVDLRSAQAQEMRKAIRDACIGHSIRRKPTKRDDCLV